MILLIDVGGTRLKWAQWDGKLQIGEPLVHNDKPLLLLDTLHWRDVSAVWISLVPRMQDAAGWTEVIHKKTGIEPRFAQSQAEWNGLRSSYAEPQKLGVDRWLAMVALWHEQRQPFCLVSAGSALTFDRVDASGQHLGGIIAPGYGSMHRALLGATRTTPEDKPHRYDNRLGTDSISAIRQGAFFAAMGVISSALNAPGADASERRIITGGDASALLPTMPGQWQQRPSLVLEGLLALAQSST